MGSIKKSPVRGSIQKLGSFGDLLGLGSGHTSRPVDFNIEKTKDELRLWAELYKETNEQGTPVPRRPADVLTVLCRRPLAAGVLCRACLLDLGSHAVQLGQLWCLPGGCLHVRTLPPLIE